jgi:hypothetical protein
MVNQAPLLQQPGYNADRQDYFKKGVACLQGIAEQFLQKFYQCGFHLKNNLSGRKTWGRFSLSFFCFSSLYLSFPSRRCSLTLSVSDQSFSDHSCGQEGI